MSLDLELTTELEAVNAILGAVGESPINSFDDNFTDATLARQILRQTSRETQGKGWHFNTEPGWVLQPDNDGFVWLPRNTARMIPEAGSENLVQRGFKVYDRDTKSYTFTSSITVDLVLILEFEELPDAARQFITVRAARRFQDQYQGDESIHRFKERDELVAKSLLENFEAETAKHNVLTNSALMQRIRGGR